MKTNKLLKTLALAMVISLLTTNVYFKANADDVSVPASQTDSAGSSSDSDPDSGSESENKDDGSDQSEGEEDGSGQTEGEEDGSGQTEGEEDSSGQTEGEEDGSGQTEGKDDGSGQTEGEEDGSGQTEGEEDGSGQTEGEEDGSGQTEGKDDGSDQTEGENDGSAQTEGEEDGSGQNKGEENSLSQIDGGEDKPAEETSGGKGEELLEGKELEPAADKKPEEDKKVELEYQEIIAEIYTDGTKQQLACDEVMIILTGEMPAGVYAEVYPVELQFDELEIDLAGEEHEILVAYDITLYDADGETYEIEDRVTVSIQLAELPEGIEDAELNLLHISDAVPGAIAEVVTATVEVQPANTVLEFEVEHFSTYAVTITRLRKTEALTTVDTVDHEQYGIIMKMVNFTSPNGLNNDLGANGFYGDGSTKQGLVKPLLSNGYPVTIGNKNLSGYFSGAYEVNNLFLKNQYDDTGYFYYDSTENFASLLDQSSGAVKRDFTVYEQLGTPSAKSFFTYQRGNFMPYNRLDTSKVLNYNYYDYLGNALSSGDYRYGEPLYGFKEANDYYFGMIMETDFYQLEGGYDTDGLPLIFEFNGDDDMWVFIDDVLVLDLGGIHDAQSGYIDYSTGEVGYTSTKTGEPLEWNFTSIKEMFDMANKNANFNGNTFADFTIHTMKIFYMERGAGASNLKIKFKLCTLKEGNLMIGKKVEGLNPGYQKPYDFKFYVNGIVQTNRAYKIYGDINEAMYFTDATTGIFQLKDGNTAVFDGMTEGQKYYVEEVNLDETSHEVTYEVNIGDESTATGVYVIDGVAQSEEYTYIYNSNKISVIITNVVSGEQTGVLKVTKAFDGVINSAPGAFAATFNLYRVDNDVEKLISSADYSEFTSGSYTFTDLIPGVYVVKEAVTNEGGTTTVIYEHTTVTADSTITDGTASSAITVAAETISQADFVNYYKNKGTVIINKVDGEGSSLAGAGFRLEIYDTASGSWDIVSSTEENGLFTSDENGKITLENLVDDKCYRLTEEIAPTGYDKLKSVIYFKLVSNKLILTDEYGTESEQWPDGISANGRSGTITVVNTQSFILPETGGIGSAVFRLAGGAILVLAAAGIVLVLKKRNL